MKKFNGAGWKTAVLDEGSDISAVGHSLEQMSFTAVQAAGENRIAAAVIAVALVVFGGLYYVLTRPEKPIIIPPTPEESTIMVLNKSMERVVDALSATMTSALSGCPSAWCNPFPAMLVSKLETPPLNIATESSSGGRNIRR